MLQDQEKQNNNEERQNRDSKKKARRTRKDEDGRDFFCPCGKSYLSYPALYTHIKTKHDGKTPGKDGGGEQPGSEKEDLEKLKVLLGKHFSDGQRGTAITVIIENLQQVQASYVGPLLKYWEQQEEKAREKENVSGAKKYLSADMVFGRFLFEMNKRTTSECINFLCRMIYYLKQAVCEIKNNSEYCSECTASMIPSTLNEIITGSHLPPPDDLDKNMQDAALLCKIIMFLCGWMFSEEYTNFTVKYKGI